MTPHILLIAQSGSLLCQHCCQMDPPPRDMPVERWIDHCKGFVLMHKHCEKAAEASRQVALFDALEEKELQRRADMFSNAIDVLAPEPVPPPIRASDMLRELEEDDKPHRCCCGTRFAETWERLTHWETCAKFLGKDPGIDAMTDDPAPEIDPPGPPLDPVELRHLVTCVRPKEFWPTLKEVESWHQDVRTAVQAWCRSEHAKAHPIAGQPVPYDFTIPNVLTNLEHRDAKPKKRGARPLSSPRGKRAQNGTGHDGPVNA